MATKEERAKLNLSYEKDFLGMKLSDNMVCRAYVKGATEQEAITNKEMIEKAKHWAEEQNLSVSVQLDLIKYLKE